MHLIVLLLLFLYPYSLEAKKVFFWTFNWEVIVGLSRIYLGVHYPFDILGGMFWGLFVSLLVYNFYNRFK